MEAFEKTVVVMQSSLSHHFARTIWIRINK